MDVNSITEDLLPYAAGRQVEVLNAVLETKSWTLAGKALSPPITANSVKNSVKRVYRKMLAALPSGDAKHAKTPQEYETVRTEETQDGFVLNVQSLGRIQSASEAMEKAGLNDAIWMPVKVVANSWEVAVKLDDGVKTIPLWQVKVTCSRRVAQSIEDAADALAERICGGKFKWPTVHLSLPTEDKSKLFMGLVDHHFAKLCWAPETRNSYDLNIAADLFARAMRYTLRRTACHDVEEIVIPIGNDYCHIDTRRGTTEAGTQLDFDGRYEKMGGVAEEAAIKAVAEARQYAPVRVVWVGGNHDKVTSMWICRCIHHAFANDPHVIVDTSPQAHKYLHFGKCLVGLAHGDAPKEKSLKDMMPIEVPHEWAAASECREWLTGHLHQQKKTERIGTHEQAGMVFRILPSLTGTDFWHYVNGFCMSRKATESYIYSHEFGFSDSIQASARRLLGDLSLAS